VRAQLLVAMVTIGPGPAVGSTRVTIGPDTITLPGVAPAAVTAADFTLNP
jgi:hypothetical protein